MVHKWYTFGTQIPAADRGVIMSEDYLLDRNGALYFRMRVPDAFRKQLGMSEIRHILKENNLHVAREKSKYTNTIGYAIRAN